MLARSLLAGALILANLTPALAADKATFGQVDVGAKTPPHQLGFDSGISFANTGIVRVSASGLITPAAGACATALTADGCGIDPAADDVMAPHQLKVGTLVAAFTDANNALVTNWAPVGSFASLVVPSRAAHLVFKLNGFQGPASGTFHVVSDVAPGGGTTASLHTAESRTTGSRRGTLSSATAVAAPGTSVADVQYLLRRLGFSDTPANVAYIVKHGGASYWLSRQTDRNLVDRNANYLTPLAGAGDDYHVQGQSFIDREFNYDVASDYQLKQKMTWHWLELYSVGFAKIHTAWEYNGATMQHYIETVRKDSLGNWGKLVTDVAKEPAMLIWLDNLNNDGTIAATPPNENFARELLQLYTEGPFQLHSGGNPYLDSNGNPVDRYSSSDVKNLARAVTGFQLNQGSCPNGNCTYPNLSQITVYNPARHSTTDYYGNPATSFQVIDPDHIFADPGNAGGKTLQPQCAWDPVKLGTGPCVIDNFVKTLTHDPVVAAYQSRTMIQRFANENPSQGYVHRIAAIWTQYADDTQQIAKVITAIANDPEFYSTDSRSNMVKEPIEYQIDAIRALGGATLNSGPNNYDVVYADRALGSMGQAMFDPPSVFSFYAPGPSPYGKESLMNTATILARWTDAVVLTRYPFGGCPGSSCRAVNLGLNQFNTPVNTVAQATTIATYLVNALIDGGATAHPDLVGLVGNYIYGFPNSGADSRIIHGLWVLLTSPEYEVN